MPSFPGGRTARSAASATALFVSFSFVTVLPADAQGPLLPTGPPRAKVSPLFPLPPPIVIDNGEALVEVGIDPESSGGPGDLLAPLISLDNLSIAGADDRFDLKEERFWELTFVDLASGSTETVNSTQFSALPPAPVEDPGDGDKITRYRWLDVVTPVQHLGPAHVELELRLKALSTQIEFTVRVIPADPAAPVTWSLVSGGPAFPMFQDPDYGGEHTLLTPLGDLITDPVGTIGNQPNGSQVYDLLNFSISQVFAFQREDGAGLWGALLDPSGTELRRVRFISDPDDATLTAVQASYMDGVYLDGTLYDDPGSGPNEDLVPVTGSALEFVSRTAIFSLVEGDWWDVAALYHDYFAGTDMAAAGTIDARTDLPPWVKDLQGVFVFPAGTKTAFDKPGQGSVKLVKHLSDYADHYGIPRSNLCAMFFGLTWTAGSTANLQLTAIPDYGVNGSGAGLDYETLLRELDSAGFRTGVYVFDSVAVQTSNDWYTKWKGHSIIGIDGQPLIAGTASTPLDPLLDQGALISPSLVEWQVHMAQVAMDLAADPIVGGYGVDLMYLDNFIPTQLDADLSEDNDHKPGYGAYQIEGYLDTLQAILGSGVAVYTEAPQEFYVAAGFMPPYMDFTDLVSEDEKVTQVPLISVLYHDFAMLGPARGECFVHGIAGGCDPSYPQITSSDPAEAADARLSAQYAYSLALVNGSSFWIPELAVILPGAGWGYEADLLYGGQTALLGSLVEMRGALDFVARMVRYRGSPSAGEYLLRGRRLRDAPLELFDDASLAVSTVPVEVSLVGATVQSGGVINGVEKNDKAPVVQGAWKSPDGVRRGVVLVNYDAADLVGRVTLNGDARHLGLDAGATYDVVVLKEDGTPSAEPATTMSGAGLLVLQLDLPGEGIRLVELSPSGG